MNHLGLALSGGGFRGTLYHLGVVRFLHDADLLKKVTHITSVSGGSVLGAHLALNWNKYCGSDADFDEAAAEIIRYTQLDVRNRIVRRFPFTSSLNSCRRMLRMGSNRQHTRAGLLEAHYEKHLYGDVPLSQLPNHPQLHILATNLSEGCLCSFTRNGLLLQRRASGKRDRFERIGVGLATVPMAVAASSAFPGFFPPLELNGWDIGAEKGEFDCQAFTDGGVYDNLGLRMFRCLEQSWNRDSAPLTRDDLLAAGEVATALRSASSLPEGTPIRRLAILLGKCGVDGLGNSDAEPTGDLTDSIIRGCWELIRSEKLYRDPAFAELELTDSSAQPLLNYLRTSNREPEAGDQLWINRLIIESVLQQVIGKPCIRTAQNGFESILVSDAGGKFKVASDGRAGGLVKTALRSTDILMDRVWQLELDAFANTSGMIACPIKSVVTASQDPFAVHPEMQRLAMRIRTDMDRFSDLEVTTLIQHGYCVARQSCRDANVQAIENMPQGPPWVPKLAGKKETSKPEESDEKTNTQLDLAAARTLRRSSLRRTWSTALSWSDWPTYVWIPLIFLLVLSLPYSLYQSRKRSNRQQMVLSAIAASSPLYRTIVDLLGQEPAEPPAPISFGEVDRLEPPDTSGFEILSDSRVFDLRGWNVAASGYRSIVYDRLRIRRVANSVENSHFRIQVDTVNDQLAFEVLNESLNPRYQRMKLDDGKYRWEMDLDFSRTPMGDEVDLLIEGVLPTDTLTHSADAASFSFSISATTGITEIWILMPRDREHDQFQIVRYPIGQFDAAEHVKPDSHVELPIGSIATFRLLNPTKNYQYECRWRWVPSK